MYLQTILIAIIGWYHFHLATNKGYSGTKYLWITFGYCLLGQIAGWVVTALAQMDALIPVTIGTLIGGYFAHRHVRKLRPIGKRKRK